MKTIFKNIIDYGLKEKYSDKQIKELGKFKENIFLWGILVGAFIYIFFEILQLI